MDRKVSVCVGYFRAQRTCDWVICQHSAGFTEVKCCATLIGGMGIERQGGWLVFPCACNAAWAASLVGRIAILISAALSDPVGRVEAALENHAAFLPFGTMVNDWW